MHHILLYGCDSNEHLLDTPFKYALCTVLYTHIHYRTNCHSPGLYCRGAQRILYAWAKNAPSLQLPPGVAHSVGHDGDHANFIVMQVHYATPYQGHVWDHEGILMTTTDQRPERFASVYLFMSLAPTPPGVEAFYHQMACEYTSEHPVRPFAYRTHSHVIGRLIGAFVHKPNDTWQEVGRRDPRWPQIFASVTTKDVEITRGDKMFAFCRFDSTSRSRTTPMGATNNEEMCNFYMMYSYPATIADPLADPNSCANGGDDPLWSTFPETGRALLPRDEVLEKAAHSSDVQFGRFRRRSTISVFGMSHDTIHSQVLSHSGRN